MKYVLLLAMTVFVFGCAPTVSLQTPDKPLEINLNVKVDHQISVKVDKHLEEVMTNNEGIF